MSTQLNSNQLEAVQWSRGPLLVLAGPGSGKTLVLTLRIARLLKESPEKRFRVLGLTFTNKAAAEMRTRIEQLVPAAAERTLLTTFHSFAADVLRQHGSHVGLSPDFAILSDDADREEIILSSIRRASERGATLDETDARLLPLITNLAEKLVAQDEVASRIRDPELRAKVEILYRAYRDELRLANALDYPSLLAFAYEVLTRVPPVAQQIRIVYPHVCVDEFQDTNLAQYLFLRAIVGTAPKDLFVVADDDQIIYEWNGASPERLRELRQDYDMGVIQLPANYRCPPQVIALANELIKHNSDRSPDKQPLIAVRHSDPASVVRVQVFDDPEDEVNWVVQDLRGKSQEWLGGTAILARTRSLVEAAATALNEAGILAVAPVRKSQFATAPFRWLYSSLRLANSRGDREQLRRMSKAFYDLEGIDVRPQDVVAAASAIGGDLFRAWLLEANARKELGEEARAVLAVADKELADRLDYQKFVSVSLTWFEHLKDALGLDPEGHFTEYEEELRTWRELVTGIQQRFGVDDTSLNVLLHELDLSSKQPPIPSSAVRCFTIHSAKGMEFDHVYLIGMAEDVLPLFRASGRAHSAMKFKRSVEIVLSLSPVLNRT